VTQESIYPESKACKSTQPSGSGVSAQDSTGNAIAGSAEVRKSPSADAAKLAGNLPDQAAKELKANS